MKTTINPVFLIIMVFILGCFCPPASGQPLIFNTQDFPPFSYLIEGQVAGPAVRIIQTACRKSGLDCTFKLRPWTRAQKEVRSGKAHALFLIGRNPERETWLRFSPPILKTEYGFFFRSDNPVNYTGIGDISGYTIGVYGPSNTSDKLSQLRSKTKNAFSIDIRPDDESGFRKLAIGRIHAVFSNRDAGFALICKLNLKNIWYAGKQCDLDYYIGFSKAHTTKTIVDRFNTAVTALKTDGTVQRILNFNQLTPAGPCQRK
ncbi:MAG: transporter substrate-binding domain-containing protein [Desulfobacter sp.]|nr:MAG: transporter substrate-binding domain-containing protein [Desulfobacter sp.]